MTLDELRKHKPQIEAIAARHGITNIRVFGFGKMLRLALYSSPLKGERLGEGDFQRVLSLWLGPLIQPSPPLEEKALRVASLCPIQTFAKD